MNKVVKLKKNPSIRDLQEVNKKVYEVSNDRSFSTWEIFSNQEKFLMRAMKGIRQGDPEKLKFNLLICTSWLLSLMNRFHIDLQDAIWKRFPYVCSYCAQKPCICWKTKLYSRVAVTKPSRRPPKTIAGFQKMFAEIYTQEDRTIVHEAIHLVEEHGEISEAIQNYSGSHKEELFKEITIESADYFSCLFGLCNKAKVDFEKEIRKFYSHNCHECRKAPCVCDFEKISHYKS
jgi:NTP pyrophosphatase (non-canonical NTP hydrolase)